MFRDSKKIYTEGAPCQTDLGTALEQGAHKATLRVLMEFTSEWGR